MVELLQTVYEVTNEPVSLNLAVVVFFGVLFSYGTLVSWQGSRDLRMRISIGIQAFFLSMSLFVYVSDTKERNRLLGRSSGKDYKVIEGTVENFRPLSGAGSKTESFEVKGVGFRYVQATVMLGFHHTKQFGGPIDEGKYVRISYIEEEDATYKNLILKLEVK